MSKAMLLSILFASALTAAPADAQTPSRGATPVFAGIDRNRVYFDVDAEGTVWVRGRTYKASFARTETAYIPFLGSHAPRNFPVALKVESVTIGGAPIAFDANACAVRTGDTIEYDRGAFRERWLLAPDSAEQTFVFETLPGRGEIVVTLAVDTELTHGEDADGLRFENELGHVRYGRAFAFDTAGAKVPIGSRLRQGRIEIVAPQALVESALGAFVIDPVLSTWTVEASSVDEFGPDTAYDASAVSWLTVCEELFSTVDHDIHVVRHTIAGVVTATAYVDSSTTTWIQPAIANNNRDGQFLVVAAVGNVGREIWGRKVDALVALGMSAQFMISDPFQAGEKLSPDVGGDASLLGTVNYCVVWEQRITQDVRHDIQARLVPTSGSQGPVLLVAGAAGEIHRKPAISNSNGKPDAAARFWNVVYEHDSSPTNRNIDGRRISSSGSMNGTSFAIGTGSTDERNPSVTAELDVTGSVDPWMVAWEIDSGANGWDVRCRTLDGTTILSTFNLSAQFPLAVNDQLAPSCDSADGQFVVGWEDTVSDTSPSRIMLATLNSSAGVLGVTEGALSIAPGTFLYYVPKVVSQESSGSSGDDVLVVYERHVGTTGQYDVAATSYDVPNGGDVNVYCTGIGHDTPCPCGNVGAIGHGCPSSVNPSGAVLGFAGNARISDDTFQLRADDLPTTAPVLFFQGTLATASGMGAVFGDGLRCVSGTVIRLALRTASGGFVVYPSSVADPAISVVGALPASGGARFYQVWYRNSGVFCTPSTFNLTNGLSANWIP